MSTMIDRRSDTWPQRLSEWFDVPDILRWFDRVGRLEEFIRIEECMRDGTLEIRAELPGIDPDRDVDIAVADGLLTIHAERREESTEESTDEPPTRRRTEFRYGAFTRTVAVPEQVQPSDITASYRDGILVVSVPMPSRPPSEVTKVPVTRS